MEAKGNMPERRTKSEQRARKKKARPIVDIDLGIDLDLDFDVNDFDVVDDRRPRGKRQKDVRILRPRLSKRDITQKVAFENAEAFARQIDLTPGARMFAWVSGNFIFGDIVEALITARQVGIKRLYLCSLSISQENIDSLKNVMLMMGDELERVVLVFSGYQYSHEKYDLVPYMYRELDDAKNRVQIAFGRWHAKLITLETVNGHTLTVHGSANLRSSNSIEQIMVEVDDRELHDFNAGLMDAIAEKFGTINHSVPYTQLKAMPHKEAWEIVSEETENEVENRWQADHMEEPAEVGDGPGEVARGGAQN